MQENLMHLIFGNRGYSCFEKIYSLHLRHPKLFPLKRASQTLRLLSHYPELFYTSRSNAQIFRIVMAHCRIAKKIESTFTGDAKQKGLFAQLLKIRNSVYGIAVGLSTPSKYRIFTKEHLVDVIRHYLSGVRPIQESEVFFSENGTDFFYLEVKKMRGVNFSTYEIQNLTRSINTLLQEKVESVFQPLSLPGIEEDMFKHIKQLSLELTCPEDIPQVFISLSEYLGQKLIFLVSFVRLIKQDSPAISVLLSQTSSSMEIFLERTQFVGYLNNKYPKEASIFRIHVNSSLMFQNHTIDIRAARQYLIKILENSFGEVRDFNGGLLIKEDEQMQEIKNAATQKGIRFPLIEDLFYKIRPNYVRPLISTSLFLKLVSLMESVLKEPCPEKNGYRIIQAENEEALVIKTDRIEWLTQMAPSLLATSSHLGWTYLIREGILHLLFFELSQKELFSLSQAIKTCIQKLLTPKLSFSKKVLRLNLQAGDPPSLNPRLAADIHSHTLCNLLFEGLMRINNEGNPEPAGASSVKISPSGLEYTFFLRPSSWSNGTDVTAYDYERSWKKALLDSVPSFLCPRIFFLIKNAQKARAGECSQDAVKIEARNRLTLHVELETPCYYFLHLVSTPLFFPLYGESEEPKHFNGSFFVESWVHDQSITLSRNPFYWNTKQCHVNNIIFTMESSAEKIYSLYLDGEIDLIGDPLSPLTSAILKQESNNKDLISKEISRIFWIHCNRSIYPLHNKYLRKALNTALNRKKIAYDTFYQQTPTATPLPHSYISSSLNLEGDPELAKHYFQLALKELNLSQNQFPILELIHSNLAFEKNLVAELKKQWGEILGLQINSKELAWNEFSSALEKGNFQLGGLFRRDLFNHPQYYLSFFQSSPMNVHGLDHLEYEMLFRELHQKNDRNTLKRIEEILVDETPVFPLLRQVCFGLAHSHIKNVNWYSNGCLNLKEVYFEN